MTKYWIPGRVKTRLAASIGLYRAARLHRLFVNHLSAALAQAGTSREIVYAPDDHEQQLWDWRNLAGWTETWGLVAQGEGDLGERMCRWFAARLRDHGSAILIGADCPLLALHDIDHASLALDDADIVLGPAVDGGYYLIGIRSSNRTTGQLERLFADVPWSTPDVFAITRRRIEEIGLNLVMLDEREDIDTDAELSRLQIHLASHSDSAVTLGREIGRVLRSTDNSDFDS